MSVKVQYSKQVGDTQLVYLLDDKSGKIELRLTSAKSELKLPDLLTDSVVQLKIRGDEEYGRFGSGMTMRDNGTMERFRFASQTINQKGHTTKIITELIDDRNLLVRHILSWIDDTDCFTSHSEFINNSDSPVTLDMIESFAISGIAGGRYSYLHRFRSFWSAEARHRRENIAELGLERSGAGEGYRCERFGQVGSMPVRNYHPFVAIENCQTKSFIGATLAWAGSWELSAFCRRVDTLTIAGGLADREFGHWSKKIMPSEKFVTPDAIIAYADGRLDKLCDKLLAYQKANLNIPQIEEDLPIIFNEWCTTWGDPTEDKVLAIADKLKETPTTYLVIDAGWFKSDGSEWYSAQGDWVPNSQLFPKGIAHTANEIRKRGLIPGVWFEMEVAGPDSKVFHTYANHHLKIDGEVINHSRHFWDLNDDVALDYLEERVVQQLKNANFGYLKVDYNETIGLGCDHIDSIGEGLRLQTLGTYRLFKRLREVNPDLVIENCASGGHRLEPSMFALTSMSSFSDAHEELEIPVIAASLHRLMLPRQNQIWSVVKPSHSLDKLIYILTSAMLGRFCLSGDILNLNSEQWNVVTKAMTFYQSISHILRDGYSEVHQENLLPSWRDLHGYQFVIRSLGEESLVIVHAFQETPEQIELELASSDFEILNSYLSTGTQAKIVGNKLILSNVSPFTGNAVLLG